MRTIRISPYSKNSVGFAGEIRNILQITKGISIDTLLSINPRDGDLPLALKAQYQNMTIDSFISDEKWIEPAKDFSNIVITGNSHHPLGSISANSYDAILVCEDIAQVDDVDSMVVSYHRVLKPGGVLLCPVWNMRYHLQLMCILRNETLSYGQDGGFTHTCGTVPIDGLTARLNEIGFEPIELYSLYGEYADVSTFVEISIFNDEPADESYFLTKIYFVKAVKK